MIVKPPPQRAFARAPARRTARTPARVVCPVLVAALWVAGCDTVPKPALGRPDPPAGAGGGGGGGATKHARPTKPCPAFADAAAAYNARLARLDRVQSPVSLIVTSYDDEGQRVEDQLEGNLMVIPPRKVSLRIDKVAQTLAYLGCNDEQFWSIDVKDPATARVGRQSDTADPAFAPRDLGLPVHPIDLLELLGITPLPADGRTAWSEDGRLLVSVHGRWSTRRLLLDPTTSEPLRIDMLDRTGATVVSCELSMYADVKLRDTIRDLPRMATRFVMTDAKTRGSIRLNVVAPENPGDRMRTAPFDLKKLLDANGVKTVVDLDAPRSPKPAQRRSP